MAWKSKKRATVTAIEDGAACVVGMRIPVASLRVRVNQALLLAPDLRSILAPALDDVEDIQTRIEHARDRWGEALEVLVSDAKPVSTKSRGEL